MLIIIFVHSVWRVGLVLAKKKEKKAGHAFLPAGRFVCVLYIEGVANDYVSNA